MPRVTVGPVLPDQQTLDGEITRLRGLDIGRLRAQWHTAFGRNAPAHLSRHLVFRILVYRLQVRRWGDLDAVTQRLLDQSDSPEKAAQLAARRASSVLHPGTVLGREWNGDMHRVTVLADGFAWNGKTYQSLSKIAYAITGTNWNGPKFFGLRETSSKGSPRA
jgi:hypothetical protein